MTYRLCLRVFGREAQASVFQTEYACSIHARRIEDVAERQGTPLSTEITPVRVRSFSLCSIQPSRMEMKLWQSSYSVVSFAEMSRRTVSSDAMEPGAALRAFRKSGRRQSVDWFTGPSLLRSRESDSGKLGNRGTGVTERRCARLLIGNTRVSIPCVAISTLSRRWSARLSEAQEDSVRFRGESPGKF